MVGKLFVYKKNLTKNLKKHFWSKFMSSQIWFYFIFWEGVWGPKIKVAQNVLKHILVLEFLKSDGIFEISYVLTNKTASPTMYLSLHLNHLIASCMGICYRQFGTLPIGIFLSNLDSRQLDTSLMISYGHFWHMSTFGNSRAVWVLLPKYGALRKSKFSQWRSDQWLTRLGGIRWADNWATWWYHFFGVWHT